MVENGKVEENGKFDDNNSNEIRSRNYSKKMWKTFSSYSQESTIHSMNYIGKSHLHWVERVFWIVAFLFSFTSCTYLVLKTYERWKNDPMIVTFKERSTPAWQIPFPAVTICPETKTDIEKFNLTEVLIKIDNNETLTPRDAERYEALYQVCNILIKRSEETEVKVIPTLRDVSNNFPSLSTVKLAQMEGNFKEYFKETITSNGICYSYNMLSHEDFFKKSIAPYLKYPKGEERSTWTIFGYNTSEPITHPTRVLGSGKEAEMEITLRMKAKDVDFACKNSGNGFRLTFHTPDELAQTTSHFHRIPFNFETLISVEPKVMTTSKDLQHYLPKQRQCYFSGEKRLNFFKGYSQLNCKLECFTEFVLQQCGCVRFSMPHQLGTKICERKKLQCIRRSQMIFTLMELSMDVQEESETRSNFTQILEHAAEDYSDNEYGNYTDHTDDDDDDGIYEFDSYADDDNHLKGFKSCGCLPSCSSIDYAIEISQSPIYNRKHLKANNLIDDDDEEYETAVVSIYFKEDYFIEAKRSELYGLTNFLSNCGGFLGLLMGGSFLSLIEIVYHLTLRKIFQSKKHKKENSVHDE